jgi:formylmethanofuran dehydrogenase subunit E
MKNTDDCATNAGADRPLRSFEEAVRFHGHLCPGLTLGYRVAKRALEELVSGRSADEELVAIVENDTCAVDAIQVIAGCTVGKGNLILRDVGKHVYIFINRETGKAVRIAVRGDFSADDIDPALAPLRDAIREDTATEEEKKRFWDRMHGVTGVMLDLPDTDIFTVTHPEVEIPGRARVFRSVRCDRCGEMVAESRARIQNGKIVCIPCFGEYTRGW